LNFSWYNISVLKTATDLEENAMYQVGDQVVYGIHGVCRVADKEKQIVSKKAVTYLVLEPVGQEGSRYLVPMSSEAAMSKLHPILKREELEEMLRSPEVRQEAWIREENLRKQAYRDVISSGQRVEIMKMVHSLYAHKHKQMEAGKKFHLADENFLRDAEKMLSSEISVVMGTSFEEAKAYLREQLKNA
jgi:CarD family transcriptional regulator